MIRVSLFANGEILKSITCLDQQIITDTPSTCLSFEKGEIKSKRVFDISRHSEIEALASVWKDPCNLTKQSGIIEILKTFENNFEIREMKYDFGRFFIYRVKMIAKQMGVIEANRILSFQIEIKSKNEPLLNESESAWKIGTQKKLEINLNTIVWFYFTDIYK